LCANYATKQGFEQNTLWTYSYEITGNAADYKVIWEEQDSPCSASKCDKLIIHLITNTSTGEEQLVAITIFATTGRIQLQGKKIRRMEHF